MRNCRLPRAAQAWSTAQSHGLSWCSCENPRHLAGRRQPRRRPGRAAGGQSGGMLLAFTPLTPCPARAHHERHADNHRPRGGPWGLALGAWGSSRRHRTSPLYTMKEVFAGRIPATERRQRTGVLSLVFWALIVVVSSSMSSSSCAPTTVVRAASWPSWPRAACDSRAPEGPLGSARTRVFGASLFYGDGMITPAISVLSAVEGLQVATPAFEPIVVRWPSGARQPLPLSTPGHARVGYLFGPVMMLWFGTLGHSA